jgi:hypothetical protein
MLYKIFGWRPAPAGLLLCVAVQAQVQAQEADGPRFAVSGYTVEGDNPLSVSATQALLAPYTGVALSIDRLEVGWKRWSPTDRVF